MNAVSEQTRRRRNAASTRRDLLAAARARFLQQSYENVGLRDIAGDVGVDVALVGRYFGSKEGLFKEVLRGGRPSRFRKTVSREGLPGFLASLFAEDDGLEQREHVERLLIMLRSASSPAAFEVVRKALRQDVLRPLEAAVGGDDAEIGARLSLAVLMGATMLRTLMTVEPRDACRRDAFRERLLRLFEAAVGAPCAGKETAESS